ncbi:MAG: polysaccharide deacetylase family protein [Solirubrobacterales bacterium]|nr:polysaccharide deacetylase family protein [Solirubrobacterales bacterium]
MQPHHRRRRAGALAALAGVALIVGAAVGAGGGGPAPGLPAGPAGYFGRLQTLAGSGAGSFAATQRSAENAAIDRTLTYTPYVRVAGSQHREIALTFDDGPGPYTPQILSILQRANVPATFFEVGVLEKYFHDSTAEIVARGYPVGDHTESHAPMSKLSPADQQAQILTQTSLIGDYGAPFPRLFRPPYGLWNTATLALLRKYRMLMVLWTVDTSDYRRPGVQAIVSSAVSGARPGAIILMHDAGGNRTETVEALPRIIAVLQARGYRLVTVPRLLLDNPAPVSQPVVALSGSGG